MRIRGRAALIAAAIGVGLSGAAFAGPGGTGHGHVDSLAYGEPGNPKKPARSVEIIMKEDDGKMLFLPDHIEVRKGEQIRFSMKNHGESDHEFVLGTDEEIQVHAEAMRKNPDMEHDDPNSKRLRTSENGALVWRFTKAGEFAFACLIPGHMESGMKGTITVSDGAKSAARSQTKE